MNNDQHLIQNLLSQSNSSVRQMIDKMPGGFFIYRAGGNEELLYANQAMIRIFNCDTLEEFRQLTGNSFRGIVHPDDLESVEQSIKEQIAQSQYDLDYVEYRIIQKGGRIRWIEDYGHYTCDEIAGNIFYVFAGDATEKKKRQAQVMDSIRQAQLQRLEMIEGLSIDYDSIFYVDLDSDQIQPYRVSSRVKDQFTENLLPSRFSGFNSDYIRTWVCPEDQEHLTRCMEPDYIRSILSKEKTFLINYKIRKDVKPGYMQLRIVNVGRDSHISQIVMGYRSVDNEITRQMEQRQLLEETLNQAKAAIVAKNIFLSNMSHDIRTPMNALFGYTALAKTHLDDRQKLLEYINGIETVNEQLLRLITDVLDISRIEAGRMHPEKTLCDLPQLIRSVHSAHEEQAAAKNLCFTTDISGLQHHGVYTDTQKLSQVLHQLTDNAIKYTEPGGHVSITAQESDGDMNSATYRFIFEDNGIGISKEFLSHIFEPFERQKNTTLSGVPGTGLGLTITKGLVEMLGGTIDIFSTPGSGSRFVITLPLPVCQKPLPVHDFAAPSAFDVKQRILLVEDNEINLEIETELLEDSGFLVDTASDGSIAVEKLQKAAPGYYSLILMDIQMPVMDGYQATRTIRSIGKPGISDIPIIALSANAFDEDRKMAIESGMNAHMAKPVDIGLLLEKISELTRLAHS